MNISIICPLYNAEDYIEDLYLNIKKQKDVCITEIEFILTESNDSTEDKSVVKVNSSKFYNAITEEYMDTSLKQPIELESTDIVITRGKMITDVNIKETNAAMYSFKTTEKKKYTFTSAIEYADKWYYDIYVLDKEYKGKTNELSNSYSRTKTTKDGSVSIKIPEGKYVYCLAKSKSAWDGFMYRNKAKLTIQVD